MATVVIYNGIELHNVLTKECDQEIVYDPSGTDLIHQKFKFRFSGVIHNQLPSSGDYSSIPAWICLPAGTGFPQLPNGVGSTATELFNYARPTLSVPRGSLVIKFGVTNANPNGTSMLEVIPSQLWNAQPPSYHTPDLRIDLDNGPKPRSVSLTSIGGDKVFRLEFSVECCLAQPPGVGGTPNNSQVCVIVNNRWSVNESIDDKFFTTRTTKGRMRLSAPFTNAHAYKMAVVPTLESGFRRDRIDFTVGENQLDCEYSVVDKQVHVAAPWPAVQMEATYTESTNDGVNAYGEMTVRMEGSPEAPPALMILQALRVIDTRLDVQFGVIGTTYMLEACSITEYIGAANVIEVRFRIRHIKETATQEGIANLYAVNFGKPLVLPAGIPEIGNVPYSLVRSRSPAIFGYDPYGLLAGRDPTAPGCMLFVLSCYLQTPWGQNHAIYGGQNPEGGAGAGAGGPGLTTGTITTIPTPLPPTTTDLRSPETRTAMYTYARCESRYLTVGPNVQLPIASNELTDADDTCVVVSLGPSVCRREILYDAERLGFWPEVPSSPATYTDAEGKIKGTLLRHWTRILPPSLTADKKNRLYRVEAYRLYALNRPPNYNERIRTGLLPQTMFSQNPDSELTTTVVPQTDLYSVRMDP